MIPMQTASTGRFGRMTIDVPLTAREVLDGLLDRFSEDPNADHRRAIVSLFDATVNDVRAFSRRLSEPVGLVCAGRDGRTPASTHRSTGRLG
jgi:hypothetical protein